MLWCRNAGLREAGASEHHGLNNVGLRDAKWRDPAAMLLADVGTRT